MHLYLRENPRTIYLVTSSQEEAAGRPPRALVVRTAENDSSRAMVELLHKDDVELSAVIRLTGRVVKGCLGLISLGEHMFLAVVTSATDIGNIRPTAKTPEVAARIHQVAFFCLTSNAWDALANETDLLSRDIADPLGAAGSTSGGVTGNAAPVLEHPCVPLSKMLSSGTFYYAVASTRNSSSAWDISTRMAVRQMRDRMGHDATLFDDRFVWNNYIARGLLDFRERLDPRERTDFDLCQFLVLVIQGFVGTFDLPLPAPPTHGTPIVATLSIVSRLGYKRAGTRFNTRGVDDDGNTANSVETEVLFCTDQHTFSYVQVRGSVPLFWEQQGLQTFGQKIQLTRPQASQPAFERHLAQLTDEYSRVQAVNLLGTKDHEAALTSAYSHALRQAQMIWGSDVGITHFDFHNIARVQGHEGLGSALRRVEGISDHVDAFGFTMCDVQTDEIITEQKGVFRTNCLDCLDRTNFVQDVLSRTTLEQYLSLVRPEWTGAQALWGYHRELWAENGDALSRIYAGTGALNTSFTRSGKRTLGGLLSDATKSVSRAYINNFTDKSKQAAIDLFLGNLGGQRQVTIFDPVHDTVNAALTKRVNEYSSTRTCTVLIGTWNLNGKPPSLESLMPWLQPDDSIPEPDILVIGFQELVPLTAQQIVQTDPEKKRLWEKKLLDTLARRPKKTADYILLRSQQLVGTALIVLVRAEHLATLRAVEGATRKTGLRGMSGNKGAVGVRLELYDTSFCFITAHLAAGHSNVEERNADYWTIADGLHFQRGKTIDDHDIVVWLADTNYRIDGDNEFVRAHVQANDLDPLLAADQLGAEMAAHTVFPGYVEGPLRFKPTYKFDAGTDTYDTSEKARIPAWTDRIVYKAPGAPLELVAYNRAELRTSDHKPVYALFRATVRVVDHAKKAALARALTQGVTATAPGETLDEKLATLTLDATGDSELMLLPPPSSETEAWWESPAHPGGVVPASTDSESDQDEDDGKNPWDSDGTGMLSASPSSSDEELFNSALKIHAPLVPTKKAPPPPPPSRKPNTN